MEGLPFETDKPLMGPHFTVMIPGQVVYAVKMGGFQIKLLAGGFFFYQLFPKLNEGNLDRALLKYEDWDVTTSNFTVENRPGGGWMGGIEFLFPFNDRMSFTTGVQYLSGSSGSSLNGSYSGGITGGQIVSRNVEFNDVRTRFEGIEISFGINF
jgi:hypothetical protein